MLDLQGEMKDKYDSKCRGSKKHNHLFDLKESNPQSAVVGCSASITGLFEAHLVDRRHYTAAGDALRPPGGVLNNKV